MEARPGSVADLFEAVIALMIAPVDEDRAVIHPVAVSGIGQIGGGRHLGDRPYFPVHVEDAAAVYSHDNNDDEE
eukprot:gene15399-20862_t